MGIAYTEPTHSVQPVPRKITTRRSQASAHTSKLSTSHTACDHCTTTKNTHASSSPITRGACALYNSSVWYEGQIRNNRPHGQGWSDDKYGNYHHGYYMDGAPNGTGIEYIAECNDIYYGEFKDGNRTGWGTYLYADGSRYVGEFVDDRCISGIYYDNNCDRYVCDESGPHPVRLVRTTKVSTNVPFDGRQST